MTAIAKMGVVTAVAIGLIAAPAGAGRRGKIRRAHKLLDKLKLVDGTGSGLDADTVRGLSPDSLRGAPGPQGPQGLQGPPGPSGTLNVYFRSASLFVAEDDADCAVASCNSGDRAISCSGSSGIAAGNGLGFILEQTIFNASSCAVCTYQATSGTIRAIATCLGP